MYIDLVQFLVASCAVAALQGILVFWAWLQDRSARWLLVLGAVFVMGGVSLLLFSLDGLVPRPISLGLGTATFIFAFFLAWAAMRLFARRSVTWLFAAVALAGWVALAAAPGELATTVAPAVVQSVLGAIWVGGAAYELWRDRTNGLIARWGLIVLFGAVAAFFALRIPFLNLMPFPFGAQPVSLSWTAAFVLSLVCAAVVLSGLSLMLTKEQTEAELRRFAMTDPLTNLPNRRAFAVDVAKLARRHAHSGRPFCLVMLDLDHFKQLNDACGHDFGDKVLTVFSEAAGRALRPNDVLYRIGGEEFCCVLPETSEFEASRVADTIRVGFRASALGHKLLRSAVTVSAGVGCSIEAGNDPVFVQAVADDALYRAKRMGRDRIAVGSRDPIPDQDVEWAAA
jgi:diguanylate cyclase (GGDEF)-like protein